MPSPMSGRLFRTLFCNQAQTRSRPRHHRATLALACGLVGAAALGSLSPLAAQAQVLADPRVASRAKTMQGFDSNIGKYTSLVLSLIHISEPTRPY